VVPHPLLTDAHQLKNAEAVNSYDAGIIIQQDMLVSDPKLLLATVDELLNDSKRRAWLGENLGRMFRSNAAENVAKVVADVVDS
jgi:UDP-N-acetylglucosamine:LPS N-acetylglucosamine transferase